MRVFTSADELREAAGDELGTSDWLIIDQARIDLFAEATGDAQWIHVDPERAADGPFGATIAHGFLTLSLIPVLAGQNYLVKGARMGVNYGLNKVRFLRPVRVGSRVRAITRLLQVEDVDGGVQLYMHNCLEIEGADRPACAAENIGRYYFS
jgi:acyl dehydratase